MQTTGLLLDTSQQLDRGFPAYALAYAWERLIYTGHETGRHERRVAEMNTSFIRSFGGSQLRHFIGCRVMETFTNGGKLYDCNSH